MGMFELGEKSVPKVELSEYHDPIGTESDDVERSLVARLTTIGQEDTLKDTVMNLRTILEELGRDSSGLSVDAVARLREDVAKKRSELLQKRMSENHDLQSEEEIRDLYDLAVLDAGLGEGDGEDIQIVKDFFELRVKKAEDLGSLFEEIKLVDELFANGASG
ncbi:MAG: hypothetical protein HGB37_04945 [Candidatus Moranbacteria bacterium]|nr:hypothetical protein [Candidatus Moranbacteria bacterium]